jgi:hypothetical protein
MIFNGVPYIDQVWRMIFHSVKRWKVIFKPHMEAGVETFCTKVSQILVLEP